MKTLYISERNIGSLGVINIIKTSYQASSITHKDLKELTNKDLNEHYDIAIIDGKVLHTSSSHQLELLSQKISIPILLLAENPHSWLKFIEQLSNLHGIIKRNSEVDFFLHSINVILGGGYCYSWDINSLRRSNKAIVNSMRYAAAGLTKREEEILIMFLNGYTNKDISIQLSRSGKTISAHKSNILRKIGVKHISSLFTSPD